MKLMILVLSSTQEPWQTIRQQGQLTTWAKDVYDGANLLFYFNDPTILQPNLSGKDLYVPGDHGLYNIGHKTLSAFRFVLEHYPDWTHLYRTNTSSYIHVPGLIKQTNGMATSKLYAGVTSGADGVPFVSGSGYLLSRDLVQLAVKDADRWNHGLIDDVALGDLLIIKNGVRPIFLPRYDCNDGNLHHIQPERFFHYRCKGPDNDRAFDVRAMKYIHKLYGEHSGQ